MDTVVIKRCLRTKGNFGQILMTIFFVFFFSVAASQSSLFAEEKADSTLSSFSGSLRLSGEGEYMNLSDSMLNPSNIFERADNRAEAFVLGSGLYRGFGGIFEAEMRFSYQYTSGRSGAWFEHSLSKAQVNQLYYQKKSDNISLLLGRKKIRWGAGYSYSPTDLVSQLKNPEDPEDRLGLISGADLLQASITNENNQIDLAYLPEIEWNFDGWVIRNNRVAIRWYRFIDPFDVSLVGMVDDDGKWAAGMNTSVTHGNALELHAEYLYTSSNHKKYPDTNLASSSFVMPYYLYRSGGVHDVVAGGQYTFENNMNLTLEYLYRSSGYSNDTFNAYVNHISYLNYEYLVQSNPVLSIAGLNESAMNFNIPLGKHYLFARLYHPDVMQSISLEVYSYLSLADGSGFFVFMPKYEKEKNYEVYFRLKKFWGKTDSEFALVPENFSAIVGFSYFLGG